MASELKVDKFTGVTTAGSIDVTGEGNSTTTNLQQGLNKVWMRWDMVASSLEDSFNISGFTDVSAGLSQLNYSSSMGNANYSIAGIAGEKTGGGNRVLGVNGNSTAPTTALIRFKSFNTSFSGTDIDICAATINGDLA